MLSKSLSTLTANNNKAFRYMVPEWSNVMPKISQQWYHRWRTDCLHLFTKTGSIWRCWRVAVCIVNMRFNINFGSKSSGVNNICVYTVLNKRFYGIYFARTNYYCYLIMVEIESRDRHYKRILLLLRTHGCNMNVNSAFSHHIALQIHTPEKWNKIKTLCY